MAGHSGLLITAADLVATASGHGQWLPLRDQSVEHTGVAPEVQLADGGCHAVETLVGCAERGQVLVMPESQQARLASPYHKDAFVYDAEADTFTCPEGQMLRFGSLKLYRDQPDRPPSLVYRGSTRGAGHLSDLPSVRRLHD